MNTFTIFWSAVFAIVFFILGIFFKALASAFNALITSIGQMLVIGGLAGLAGLGLYVLYVIADQLITESFFNVLGSVIICIISLIIALGIISFFGAPILEIVVNVVGFILGIVSSILEWFADICERQFRKCLTSITSRLNQC